MGTTTLKDKTVFISGASRGIGRAIALRAAKEGANVVITGKTAEPHPKLEGTIHTVAKEVTSLGGVALPIVMDVRDEEAVSSAMAEVGSQFGTIDVLVNNASAIGLTNTPDTSMKRFDLMMSVNARATFLCSQKAIPFMKDANNPHILNLSPPISLNPKWFKDHVAYTMSKYGMSMCTLGMAAEFAEQGIAVNSLWPKTTIATAAIKYNFPKEVLNSSRKPEIVSEAFFHIVTQPSDQLTGQFLIDEDVLTTYGDYDLNSFAVDPSVPLFPDIFLD